MNLCEMIIRELHKATPKQLRLIYKWVRWIMRRE